MIDFVRSEYGNINCEKILDIDFANGQQVAAEKEVKKNTLCLPLIKDVCEWLIDMYENK